MIERKKKNKLGVYLLLCPLPKMQKNFKIIVGKK